jgi:hypothetical protein
MRPFYRDSDRRCERKGNDGPAAPGKTAARAAR